MQLRSRTWGKRRLRPALDCCSCSVRLKSGILIAATFGSKLADWGGWPNIGRGLGGTRKRWGTTGSSEWPFSANSLIHFMLYFRAYCLLNLLIIYCAYLAPDLGPP